MDRASRYRKEGHWDDATLWRRVEAFARRAPEALANAYDVNWYEGQARSCYREKSCSTSSV